MIDLVDHNLFTRLISRSSYWRRLILASIQRYQVRLCESTAGRFEMRRTLRGIACAAALLGAFPFTVLVREVAADTMVQGWMAQNYTCAEYLHGRVETEEPERSNYSYAFFFALGYFEARYAELKDGRYLDRITKFHDDLRRVCQAYPSQNLLEALSLALPAR